jgi:hypothetical protein
VDPFHQGIGGDQPLLAFGPEDRAVIAYALDQPREGAAKSLSKKVDNR